MSKREDYVNEGERRLFDYMGITHPYKRPKTNFFPTPDRSKILSISDPHEPFSSEKVYQDALQKHHDAETVIVPGDLGDYYSKSRFRKDQPFDFKEELRSVFFRMEWLSMNFRKVLLMMGNHDNRPEKALLNALNTSAGNTELLMLTEPNLMWHFASYFENIETVGQRLSAEINLDFIYQHGDILFTHAEISREQETALMQLISGKTHLWKKVWKLKPYRVFAQAHNHRAMNMPMGTEHWYMLPTASNIYSLGMKYIFTARMMGKPPQIGYTVFYQEAGITDTNRSGHTLL